MITRTSILASLLLGAQAFAGTATVASAPEQTTLVAPEENFFSGSFTAAYTTNYTGRGLVPSRIGMQGEGAEILALKLKHDFNNKWSWNTVLAYTISSSGHSLYGLEHATVSPDSPLLPGLAGAPVTQLHDMNPQLPDINEMNMENEFVVSNEIRYSEEKWSLGFGHDFVHGGLLGVMSKHFAHNSRSYVNEFFLSPEYSPYKWLTLACPIRYSFDGIKGWWFEPSVTFKAPVIGTPDDMKMAALLSFNISATGDYFQDYHGAGANGTQAFWIKLATPYFVNEAKSFVITPSVSFNWCGKGAIKANENAALVPLAGDAYVPFQNFQVVGQLSCTYVF